KNLSLAVAGVLATGVLLAPVQVLAQDATGQAVETTTTTEEADATTLDRVTVTARRRVESIQDVPVAVTAFGEESLRDLQASSIEGLQGAVPNLNIVQGRGSANSINVFIRGIGQPDALHSFDPGVGIYVDDVYYSRINGAMFSLFDVSQVEVLRGPQGTLYGKNSTGGAIKVTTKNPFDDQGASVELLVGDEGRNEMRLYGGGSLNDNVAGSIAFAKIANDGYVTNPVTGEKYNDDDTLACRGKLALRPADNVTATFSVDWSHQEAGLTMGHPTAPLIATDLVFGAVPLAPAPTGEYDFTAVSSFTNGEGQDMTHKGGSLAIDWDISNAWLLKSITAWRKLDTNSYIDIDATALELGDVFVGVDQTQLSQEVQLQYDNGSNLQAVFGAYYQQEDIASYQEAYADDFIWFLGAPVDFLRTISDDLDTTSTAVFAHASWELAPTWTLAGGVR